MAQNLAIIPEIKRALKALSLSVFIALALCGCVDVRFGLANLMTPDHSPRTAVLAQGYVVQDAVIRRGDRLIGVTYAHHPQSQAIIVFCGQLFSVGDRASTRNRHSPSFSTIL